jgi:formylglycine-generating enzyme
MSRLQVYVEDTDVVVVLDGVRISMAPDVSDALKGALGEAAPRAKRALAEREGRIAPLRNSHRSSLDRWTDAGHPDLLGIAIQLAAGGSPDACWEALASVCGEPLAFDALASAFQLDSRGWASFASQSPGQPEAPLGLLQLLPSAPEGHALDLLWRAGAFDDLLLAAAGDAPPASLPLSLYGRLMRLLVQEQYVPPCSFAMGADDADSWDFERPAHRVDLSQGFYIMRFPVSQLLYRSVTDKSPSRFTGSSRPVEQVSWHDAVGFCNLLSRQQGWTPVYRSEGGGFQWDRSADGWRLPTEAEWECAARAWQPHRYPGSQSLHEVAWYAANSGERTHPSGRLAPNAMGLYDMGGNVWEWCWDLYGADFYQDRSQADQDPSGPADGQHRVCRGGAWCSEEPSGRVSIRGRFEPEIEWDALGFRIVRNA